MTCPNCNVVDPKRQFEAGLDFDPDTGYGDEGGIRCLECGEIAAVSDWDDRHLFSEAESLFSGQFVESDFEMEEIGK